MSDRRYAVVLPRDVLTAEGPEAEAYLQGQLSQDVAALPDGASAWSWLLAPNGKVDCLLRISRISAAEWLLDTDAGWGDAALARLQRFKLRTKVELAASGARVVGLRGPGWDAAPFEGRMVVPAWPGVDGVDVIGAAAPSEGGADWLPSEAYEALRIRAGIPLMGAELDERTIPGETGLVPWTVSFTKGCYTGQELVARIDSRGNRVPRRLRGLRFDGEVASGAELLTPDGSPAGTATSVAAQPRPATGGTEWVGLGYVRRGVDVHEELTAAGVAVRQVELVP